MLTKEQALETLQWLNQYSLEEDQRLMEHEIALGCTIDYVCHIVCGKHFKKKVSLPTGGVIKIKPEMLQAYIYGEIVPLLTDFDYTYIDMISTFGQTNYLYEALPDDVMDCYESGFIDYMGLGYKH